MSDDLFSKIEGMNTEMKAKLEEQKEAKSEGSRGRKFKEEVLKFDIKDTDPELVTFVKKLINSSNVTNKQVYDHFGTSLGYNMIYCLVKTNKPTVAWDRVRIWAEFLGYDIDIAVTKRIDPK